ncbi:MAG: sporulation protein YqfD [Evtepia sp.]|uniref:sporulation protein YqfD n=1 Tax=Evtepia sp. TaxID=2773933 RepID=UPI002A751205|nr:sporulation protein YqfD [Evtepia sp.]MDY3013715.1 sporulation protein YqfD [Evtepia sp.]
MKQWMGWLIGVVTVRITGAQPTALLNLCAREGLLLWQMTSEDPFTLVVKVPARQYSRLCRLVEEAQCTVQERKNQGIPFFLLRFRRRYALLAGIVLCVAALVIGSRTVLTVDVSGNETLTREEIISQLRLCGVSVGTYGPSIPIREVENRMMLAVDELTFFSLNLHGTRAEVIVREKTMPPEREDEKRPADVVSSADGVITHMEPWAGDPCFQEGEAVCKGDVLISGDMVLDAPPPLGTELGTMLVRAKGKIMAETKHTMTAQIMLRGEKKVYTGKECTRYSLSILGRRVKFYQNAGIPYEKYDIISRLRSWTPIEGKTLPIVWEKEQVREYTTVPVTLDEKQAEALLRERLMTSLQEQMDQGEVRKADYTTRRQGDCLIVTLYAECTEQIGRTVEKDTQEKSGSVQRFSQEGTEEEKEQSQ